MSSTATIVALTGALAKMTAERDEARAEVERLKREAAGQAHDDKQWDDMMRAESEALAKGSDEWMRQVLGVELRNRLWGPHLEAFGRGVDALRAEVERLREQLQIDPGGSDRIDELEDAAKCAQFTLQRLRAEVERLRAEVEKLRGIQPEVAPMPPYGKGLPRYGLRWNGPGQPLAVPLEDGYWTPAHLAVAEVERLRAELAQARSDHATCINELLGAHLERERLARLHTEERVMLRAEVQRLSPAESAETKEVTP